MSATDTFASAGPGPIQRPLERRCCVTRGADQENEERRYVGARTGEWRLRIAAGTLLQDVCVCAYDCPVDPGGLFCRARGQFYEGYSRLCFQRHRAAAMLCT